MNERKIILIYGMRASGKTHLYNKLKNKLDQKKEGIGDVNLIKEYDLIDIDAKIEDEERRSISEITKRGQSWQRFRDLETSALKELLEDHQQKKLFIFPGGGLFVNRFNGEKNLEILKNFRNNIFFVFLKASDEVIIERILKKEEEKIERGEEEQRPILEESLAGGVIENNKKLDIIEEDTQKMIKRRKDLYRKCEGMADMVINTGIKKSDFKKKHDPKIENYKESECVINELKKKIKDRKGLIIGIDGFDGLGKSSFAEKLYKDINAKYIALDDIKNLYMENNEKFKFKKETLEKLKNKIEELIQNKNLVIDGICLLEILNRIDKKCDFLIYIKGVSFIYDEWYAFDSPILESIKSYYKNYKPDKKADFIIENYKELIELWEINV